MRILIVGAGSTGGYFGARLMQAGRDVTFLVRPARAAALRENGLQVLSPLGDFRVEPRLAQAGEIDKPFDIVLVTVKAFALAAAISCVPSWPRPRRSPARPASRPARRPSTSSRACSPPPTRR